MHNHNLVDAFTAEVLRLCDETKRHTTYNPGKFKSRVASRGALEPVSEILNSPRDNWLGLTELTLNLRLDLSIEVLVLQHQWQPIFSEAQLQNAQRRLRLLNYPDIPEILKQSDIEVDGIGPNRRERTINSLVRNPALAKQVKMLYEYKCQVCGIALVAGERKYAEAAHIRPLGQPHNGNDILNNALCLCPNHHKLFDMGGFFVENDLKIPTLGMTLTVDVTHDIEMENFQYHKRWFEIAD